MKLIIQIPCLNETETLPLTLADLPDVIEGIDVIEVLVIDDGSTDGTADIAKANGVHHVVRFPENRGLAKAFSAGLDAALKFGADIVVNTDADNQYQGADIAKLVQPILQGDADIVIGDRQIDTIEEFSYIKKKFQKLGSWVVRRFSGTEVVDATSGFRAYSRHSALRMNVLSTYTYTLETIIQAGQKGLKVVSIPIGTNAKLRESRLMRNMWSYMWKSARTIVSIWALYSPFRFFSFISYICLLAGVGLGLRYIVNIFILEVQGRTYLQSVVLSGVLMSIGVVVYLVGFVADLVAVNRRLQEESLARIREVESRVPGLTHTDDSLGS